MWQCTYYIRTCIRYRKLLNEYALFLSIERLTIKGEIYGHSIVRS